MVEEDNKKDLGFLKLLLASNPLRHAIVSLKRFDD
jgi:hypothetical protein